MTIALAAIVTPFNFFASCTGEGKETVEVTFNPETSYTLKETNVETLLSDSGVTRYKVKTDTWLIFGKASEPYWYFPDAGYLEVYDTAFNVETKIQADTVRYYQRRGLWQLDRNVDIFNTDDNIRLETSQLFWDEKKEIFYSDSFVVITKGEDVNTGFGFLSNKDMSEYQIFNSAANFTVEMQRRGLKADSIPTDSTNTSSIHPLSEINKKE